MIETNLSSFEAILRKVSPYCGDLSEEIINKNVSAYKSLLESYDSIDNFFDPLANGSFKEVYHPIRSKSFVIKFASERNRTKQEVDTIEDAKNAGLDMFFVPTFYAHISESNVIAETLSAGDPDRYYSRWSETRKTYIYCSDPNYEPQRMTDVCVQPTVQTAAEVGIGDQVLNASPWFAREEREEKYARYPLKTKGKTVAFFIADSFARNLDDRLWWQAAIDFYGIEKSFAFSLFLEDNRIGDLHCYNYGYTLDGRPVLLDWLS